VANGIQFTLTKLLFTCQKGRNALIELNCEWICGAGNGNPTNFVSAPHRAALISLWHCPGCPPPQQTWHWISGGGGTGKCQRIVRQLHKLALKACGKGKQQQHVCPGRQGCILCAAAAVAWLDCAA